MIQEKAEHECVHIGPDRFCDIHKQTILEKQKEIRQKEGRRIGKGIAIKLLIEEVIELRKLKP